MTRTSHKKRSKKRSKKLDKKRSHKRRRAKMHRSAAESATEKMFQHVLFEAQCKTVVGYLKKKQIPYSRWPKDGVPESECIVMTSGDAHAGYYDGEYLWNPNDSEAGIGQGDGFDTLFTGENERGFSDFNGGRSDASHNSVTRDGMCFLLSLGYRNILRGSRTRTRTRTMLDQDKARASLLSMSTRQVLGRKVS